MTTDLKAPTFPESVADGTVATWHKKPGQAIERDELVVDIETDKVMLEVLAPADGVLVDIVKAEGETVAGDEVIGHFEAGAASTATPTLASSPPSTTPPADLPVPSAVQDVKLSPAARKLAQEHHLDVTAMVGTGKGGLVTKEDVHKHLEARHNKPAGASEQTPPVTMLEGERPEKRVPMTRLRARIAERLLDASQNTAMLTTFNELNMAPIMALRKQYKESFEKVHGGTRLGFMGFFIKAACRALKRFPMVNASLDGNDIVYHGYQDIAVAVSTEKGLVVPVLRDVDDMSLAAIENQVRDFGLRARDGKLGLEEIQGGTFTITNGGVFGSLLSTPLLNPPQTAILGMHKIQERPMAVGGEVVILPMMYLALSYDHRLLDGKDAVQFLVAIKELLEEPVRFLLDI